MSTYNKKEDICNILLDLQHITNYLIYKKICFYRLDNCIKNLLFIRNNYEDFDANEIDKYLSEILQDISSNIEQIFYDLFFLESKNYKNTSFILDITHGLGGDDAEDIANLLFQSYKKFFLINCKKNYEIFNLENFIIFNDALLFCKLKFFEMGVTKVIRISPFTNKRQTSFISIKLYENKSLEKIFANVKDIKIDTFKSSGKGGQHVNKTDSAVRITHIPTGIVVKSQKHRHQILNKQEAMAALEMKLNEENVTQNNKAIKMIDSVIGNASWGNCTRKICLYPNRYVKYNFGDIFYNVRDLVNLDFQFFIKNQISNYKLLLEYIKIISDYDK